MFLEMSKNILCLTEELYNTFVYITQFQPGWHSSNALHFYSGATWMDVLHAVVI